MSPRSIEIFKTGRHTSSKGAVLEMTAGDLAGIASAYDPKAHEAPVVIGHPKTTSPAFAWVKGLKVDGDRLVASVDQIDPEFSEMVKAGRFKKVSASFYLPTSPGNPTPGKYALRHVGFLGAEPPAVKGLRAVDFAEDEEGVVDFADGWTGRRLIRMFRGLRDLIVEKFDLETADRVLPADELNWLQEDAAIDASKEAPAFSETEETPDLITQAELAAREAKLNEQQAKLDQQAADFVERDRKARAIEAETFIDSLVAAGKFLPANKPRALAVMTALGTLADPLDFSEGGKELKEPPLDVLKGLLSASPKVVDLNEAAAETGAADFSEDPRAMANAASDYIAAEAAKGRVVSAAEAVRHVTKGAAA